MLSDQMEIRDLEDPLKLKDFLKNYSGNCSGGNTNTSSLFKTLYSVIQEESLVLDSAHNNLQSASV